MTNFRYVQAKNIIRLKFDRFPDYSISVADLGQTYRYPLLPIPKEYQHHFQNMSRWVIHFRGKGYEREWLTEFEKLIREKAPESPIDWKATALYLDLLDESDRLTFLHPSEAREGLSGIFERQRIRDKIAPQLIETFNLETPDQP